jgi:hypothetical protein
MWTRINYLVGLTRPSNYTLGNSGGFMVPPMVQLTLGDFYKNHFVVIKSCNVTIPDDASWETIPEGSSYPNYNWSWGPNRPILWEDGAIVNPRGDKANSQGKVAQFPRTAEINVQMSIMEKDRPTVGKALWGDSPVSIVISKDANVTGVSDGKFVTFEDTSNKEVDVSKNNFSTNIRYDENMKTARPLDAKVNAPPT